MQRMTVIFAVIALTGCATIVKGTTQVVSLSTPGVTGASCTLTNKAIGTQTVVTPAQVTVNKSAENIAVTCRKECYQDAAGVIVSGTEEMTAGNVLIGGVVGLGVDAATGAMNKYTHENHITMVPIHGCKPKAPDKVADWSSSSRSPKTA
jgi:hypothetical protein